MRLLVVGGVAGGASAAVRARRLSENAEIIIFERGPFVSFANCGLPYRVGNVIKKEDDLLVATPELFKGWFNIEVRTHSTVCHVDRKRQEIEIENGATGTVYRERYDALVLAPGAAPVKPPVEGIDLPGIFTIRSIPDSRIVMDWINRQNIRRAAVVGGGFIGLEMIENLKHLDLDVTLIEMLPQVMPTIDPEMGAFIHDHLISKGVTLCLGSPVTGFRQDKDDRISILTAADQRIPADIVILAMGVRPETELAKEAGLTIGDLGGIQVDQRMQTSDACIWAVGDAVEVKNTITTQPGLLPLAGPANRQGRIAADSIVGIEPHDHLFRGVQATAVCGVLGLTIASTGITEKQLRHLPHGQIDRDYEKIYLHPSHHANYYPDAKPIALKLIFSTPEGRILGAQAVGLAGVEKRIDVIAMAIQKHGTVFDLEEAELCYAPQYGSAKDPINHAGMIASNILRGHLEIRHWDQSIPAENFILDVRTTREFKKGHVENAVNIPLHQLRQRIGEVPQHRNVWVYCLSGQRSYFAMRILSQNGYRAGNISGGFLTFKAFNKVKAG